MGEDQKKSALVSWITTILIVGVVAGAFVYKFVLGPPSDPIKAAQLEPEGAMKMYLKHAYGFLTDASSFYDLEKCVTKEDYKWFQENYSNYFEDTYNLRSGIDPNQGDAVARISVMRDILSYGPNRDSCEIMSKKIADNTAEMVVRKKTDFGGLIDVKVRLVREGRFWKVKDYAGGKLRLLDMTQPGDFTYISSGDETEGGEGTATAAAAPAATPPPPPPNPMDNVPPELRAGFEAEAAAMGGSMAPPPPPAAVLPTPTPQTVQNLSNYMSDLDQRAQSTQPGKESGALPPAGYQPGYSSTAPPGVQGGAEGQVDQLIAQAGNDWAAGQFADSLDKAKKALVLCKQQLGDSHPKTLQVQAMVDAAQKQVNP